MKYMGSKNRIAKGIVPIIQQRIDDNNVDLYIEPFCGGCNIIDKVICDNKIASDNQKYLIAMFQHLDELDTLPEIITKEEYDIVRNAYQNNTEEFPDWYIGAIGFLASYRGRFFDGGYARCTKDSSGKFRNYYDEAKRNLLKQISDLRNIHFRCCDYHFWTDTKGAVFYLDPPYEEVKQYNSALNFDHEEFWKWAEYMSKDNIVLVSEYNAPDGWKCVWKRDLKKTMDHKKIVNSVEKLFEFCV